VGAHGRLARGAAGGPVGQALEGVRNADLERRVIEGIAERRQLGFWEVFVEADTLFEAIADGGVRRLQRS